MLDGFSIGELVDLYKRAKIIIDFHFNGPERTIWEGILFNCYPIVSHQGNGGDDIDIPIRKYSKRRSNVAVIIVRTVFISSFLLYCLFLNHIFPTNPNSIYKSDDRSNVVVIIVKVHFLTFKIQKV